jgi:hypothetical protein
MSNSLSQERGLSQSELTRVVVVAVRGRRGRRVARINAYLWHVRRVSINHPSGLASSHDAKHSNFIHQQALIMKTPFEQRVPNRERWDACIALHLTSCTGRYRRNSRLFVRNAYRHHRCRLRGSRPGGLSHEPRATNVDIAKRH